MFDYNFYLFIRCNIFFDFCISLWNFLSVTVNNIYFWCGHCKSSWKTNFNSTQDSKSWFEFQMHKWKIRKDRVHQKSLTTILVPSSIIQPSFHRWKPPIFTYVVHTRICLCHSQHMCNYSRIWYSFE